MSTKKSPRNEYILGDFFVYYFAVVSAVSVVVSATVSVSEAAASAALSLAAALSVDAAVSEVVSVAAVSYTHLDVYKRQVLARVSVTIEPLCNVGRIRD